jgi:ABC-2 type transport system ATP-binding protein
VSDKIVIQVEHLRKTYGSVAAVDDISFEVYEGEIFGIVGPNGAGKTTTIECIEGLRHPDGAGGSACSGSNPANATGAPCGRASASSSSSRPSRSASRCGRCSSLFAALYPAVGRPWEDLLMEQLGLAEKRDSLFCQLSGGQKQRLFVALALINDPEVVFPDEITTGLDPQARHAMWDLIRGIRERGKTVVLTTHFMEEAERLCDRVAIVDHGRIVALDTPPNLIGSLGVGTRVVFSVEGALDTDALGRSGDYGRIEREGERVAVNCKSNQQLAQLINTLVSDGLRFRDLRTEQPTLEDVFLATTGRAMRD